MNEGTQREAELCLEVRVKNSFWREDSTETQRSQWTDGSKLHKGLFDLNVGNTEARRKKKEVGRRAG